MPSCLEYSAKATRIQYLIFNNNFLVRQLIQIKSILFQLILTTQFGYLLCISNKWTHFPVRLLYGLRNKQSKECFLALILLRCKTLCCFEVYLFLSFTTHLQTHLIDSQKTTFVQQTFLLRHHHAYGELFYLDGEQHCIKWQPCN